MIKYLFSDWSVNKGNVKGKFIMLNYRLASLTSKHVLWKIIFLPFLIYYKIFIQWILGVEITASVIIGKNCQLYHGQSLVINSAVVIGSNCILRHGVTIGNKLLSNGKMSNSPIIGDNVEFGANSIVIGEVRVGNNVKIGAGVVIVKDIPENKIVVSAKNRFL